MPPEAEISFPKGKALEGPYEIAGQLYCIVDGGAYILVDLSTWSKIGTIKGGRR